MNSEQYFGIPIQDFITVIKIIEYLQILNKSKKEVRFEDKFKQKELWI